MSKSIDDMADNSRAQLAAERDAAIERLNFALAKSNKMVQQYNQMQQDMVRWVMAFMLLQNERSFTVGTGTLKKTDDFVLRRSNDPEAETITWSMVTREEHEADEAAREAAQKRVDALAEKAASESPPEE
jgi:NhaP-type Na+/H+ and K+/H+ antiporter